MSVDDVVCTGWLIKSPPEKKLNTRYSWRKRWFVLRQGRMSGNPDVLEYYRTKSSRKPIRTIDLQECEVQTHGEPQHLHKRPFQNQHLFVVKTATRVFYLLAKTQEEMNSWVQSISQICTFSVPDDTDSADSLSHTPTSQQPSPALSPRVSQVAPSDGATVRDQAGHSETSSPPHYLILSQCNTGTVNITRSDSFTNSELSLEQSSSEMAGEDIFLSPLSTAGPPSVSSSQLLLGHPTDAPFSAPCGPTPLCPSSSSTASSPRSLQQLPSVFCFDRPFCPTPDPHTPHTAHTPPPLPPKPPHFSDALGHPVAPPSLLLRHRVSMPSLDFRRGESDSLARRRNKMASLHLSALAAGASLSCSSDDSYVPMASPPISAVNDVPSDGYIPMSPASFPPRNSGKAEAPLPPGGDLEPPPVNRDLKPRRRARPPPLDLRGLSTIREHLPLVRMHTEPSTGHPCVSLDRRLRALTPADPESFGTPTERQLFFPVGECTAQQPWMRGSRLDYLSLDFNSASPSPVLKKPLLADEHRVDYVQVDEKKTQALQNTKLEWKDVRQSQA
ncbi:hypothetical protein ACEWY4_009882 [Coilia grayii]|uniref:PH domain-containing protein n=1 Tax=Coilia grayii TaxID=363190 RepID=A0ABD1K8D8_9TELE